MWFFCCLGNLFSLNCKKLSRFREWNKTEKVNCSRSTFNKEGEKRLTDKFLIDKLITLSGHWTMIDMTGTRTVLMSLKPLVRLVTKNTCFCFSLLWRFIWVKLGIFLNRVIFFSRLQTNPETTLFLVKSILSSGLIQFSSLEWIKTKTFTLTCISSRFSLKWT